MLFVERRSTGRGARPCMGIADPALLKFVLKQPKPAGNFDSFFRLTTLLLFLSM